VPEPGLPGPLARLHETAMRLGITVLDDAAAAGRWPDDNVAAVVSFAEHIALKPGLDDGLRTDVLAMALIVAAVMGDCPTGHPCAITAPGGLVVISQTRVPRPGSGPGMLATLLARNCGRDTASAAFDYMTPVTVGPSPWAQWTQTVYGSPIAAQTRKACENPVARAWCVSGSASRRSAGDRRPWRPRPPRRCGTAGCWPPRSRRRCRGWPARSRRRPAGRR